MDKKKQLFRLVKVLLLFALAFMAGRFGAMMTDGKQAVETAADGNWGLSFQQEGQPPVANATADYLKKFNAYYAENTPEKVLYLTFDAGYENGNTPAILDALKKHNAPATFFVVGNYIETAPDLVKRMVAEGHTVGNHTYHHPDMSKISSKEAFEKELGDLEKLFTETTGQTMKKYYRPPQGKYSETNLQMAKDMGYSTFFWSLAYVDWYQDKQPSKEEAFKKLLGRIHWGYAGFCVGYRKNGSVEPVHSGLFHSPLSLFPDTLCKSPRILTHRPVSLPAPADHSNRLRRS